MEIVSPDVVCVSSVTPTPLAVVAGDETDELYAGMDGGDCEICSLTVTGVRSISGADVLLSSCGSDAVCGVTLLVVHASDGASTTLL